MENIVFVNTTVIKMSEGFHKTNTQAAIHMVEIRGCEDERKQ